MADRPGMTHWCQLMIDINKISIYICKHHTSAIPSIFANTVDRFQVEKKEGVEILFGLTCHGAICYFSTQWTRV
jgi:hypothetical protein